MAYFQGFNDFFGPKKGIISLAVGFSSCSTLLLTQSAFLQLLSQQLPDHQNSRHTPVSQSLVPQAAGLLMLMEMWNRQKIRALRKQNKAYENKPKLRLMLRDQLSLVYNTQQR